MSRWAVGLSASSCYPQKTAYTFAMPSGSDTTGWR